MDVIKLCPTKLKNKLKAIHNGKRPRKENGLVVSDEIKEQIESNSQLSTIGVGVVGGCVRRN